MNASLKHKLRDSAKDRKLSPEESICVLNSLLCGFEYLSCLDKIEDTTLYKHSLKMKVKSLQIELETFCTGLNEVIGIDDFALYNYMEHKKQLMVKIAKLAPEHKSGLNHVLDEFFNAPALTIHRLGIKIIDRDK